MDEEYTGLDLDYTPVGLESTENAETASSSAASNPRDDTNLYGALYNECVDPTYSDPRMFEYAGTSDGGIESKSAASSDQSYSYSGGLYGEPTVLELEKEIDYMPIKDWQGELQALLKMPDSLDKWKGIARLGLDFQHAAGLYARVIVSECKLPESQKTIHTANVGGVAGGIKVICQSILFKIAVDRHGMYGSDSNAAKAAGHEFRSSNAFFDLQVPDVQVPLMAIIDYRGFRVTAMSLLPISGRETLVYGSCDGGLTATASDPEFNQKMELVGEMLNLKPHLCGKHKTVQLHLPVDVEGHVALKFRKSPSPNNATPGLNAPSVASVTKMEAELETDQKRTYVVLDLARLFPPQMPIAPPEKGSKQRSYLYELLRPELVKTNPVPLSSDAFSPFNAIDPDAKTNNEEVAIACQRLVNFRIPQFAACLEKGTLTPFLDVQEIHPLRLVSLLHRQGINLRFLGLVRKHLTLPRLRLVALTEMVARVIKDQIHQELRNTTELVQLPVDEPYRETVVRYLNLLFAGAQADTFWTQSIEPAVLKKYSIKSLDLDRDKDEVLMEFHSETQPQAPDDDPEVESIVKVCPTTGDSHAGISLRRYLDPLMLWDRISDLTGVVLRSDSVMVMSSGFGIATTDIKELRSRIRVTDVLHRALAISVSMDAKTKRGTECYRLYLRAHKLFEDCSQISASNALNFYHWGIMLHEMAKHEFFLQKPLSLKCLKLGALPKLANAVHINPHFLEAHMELGWTLLDFLLHPMRLEAASKTATSLNLLDTSAILERAAYHLISALGLKPKYAIKGSVGRTDKKSSGLKSSKLSPLVPTSTTGTKAVNTPLAISALTSSYGSTRATSGNTLPNSASTPNITTTTTTTTTAAPTNNNNNNNHNNNSNNNNNDHHSTAVSQLNSSGSSSTSISSANSKPISPANSKNISPANSKNISPTNSKTISPANSKPISPANSKTSTEHAHHGKKRRKKASQDVPVVGEGDQGQSEEQIAALQESLFDSLTDTPKLHFDRIANKIAQCDLPMLISLASSLWNYYPMRKLVLLRGIEITELDIVDSSFIPKSAYPLLPQLLPNLASLSIRNAIFLDAETAALMFCPLSAFSSINNATPNDDDSVSSTTTGQIPTLSDFAAGNIASALSSSTSSTTSSSSSSSSARSAISKKIAKLKSTVAATRHHNHHHHSHHHHHNNNNTTANNNNSNNNSDTNELDIKSELISSAAPNWPSLKTLRLKCCELLTDIPGLEMILWPSLETLEFARCGLSDEFFSSRILAVNLPSLTELGVSGSIISDNSISKLVSQFGAQLRTLDLGVTLNMQWGSCYNLMAQSPTLSGLKALNSFDLSGCRSVSAASVAIWLKHLPPLPKCPRGVMPGCITKLNLNGCINIPEDIWNSIPKKCPLLTELRMEKARVNAMFLPQLGQHCPRLESLHASSCKNLEPLGLLKVLQGCMSLKYLDASFWLWNKMDIDPKLIKTWNATNLPSQLMLEKLYICAWPMDASILGILLSKCPKLSCLDIANCNSIGPEIFITISKHCRQLQKITANSFALSDEGVKVLTEGCAEHLIKVNFTRAHDLTDASLISLAKCKNLTNVTLGQSSFITNEGVQMLLNACPTIRRLGLKGSKLITGAFMSLKLRHSCAVLTLDLDSQKVNPWNFPLP